MIKIDGNQLTIPQVIAAAHGQEKVSLTDEAKKKIARSQGWVTEILEAGKPVYGINTGFGIFSDKQISNGEITELNRNLILSHAVGTGPDLPPEVTRAAILIRANTLACGHSGIRNELVENLVGMLNKDVVPIIPAQGSLGSSGDLAPLAHLALTLTTDPDDREEDSGWAYYQGEKMSGKAAMQAAGIERLVLQAKEALAITNGATFSAALAALAIHHTTQLLNTAEITLAMSLEALLGKSAAFDPRIHTVRRQTGQMTVAKNVRKLTQGSTLLDKSGSIQDAYSLRCAPQVQGAARDTLDFVANTIANEINAVTDNPLLFGPNDSLSGGNFHGQPVGMAMDYLKIALSEVAAISERRTFHLTDGKVNAGLPPMLVDNQEAAGLNSGMMMLQYTAASLVLENQTLATPDSIKSLPTSGGKEDHNANAMTAARHAYQIAQNCAHVLAVELYCAARALDLCLKKMPNEKPGAGVQKAHQTLRKAVPYQPGDALWGPEVEKVKEMVWKGQI